MRLVNQGQLDLFVSLVVSLYLRGYNYDPAFLLCVYVGGALYKKVPPLCLKPLFKANTTLLPPGWDDGLSISAICQLVKKTTPATRSKSTFPPDDKLAELLSCPENDLLAKELFPPRTKEDLAIRVCRMGDVIEFAARRGLLESVEATLKLCRGYDYALTNNLLVARLCFGELWWKMTQDSGLFDSDAEHFRVAAKTLSDIVKKRETELSDYDRVSLYESACLYGAMCPPVPGWDPVVETHDLATGGQVAHGLLWGPVYTPTSVLESIRGLAKYTEARPHDVRTLESWLLACEWERSGSSTMGKVEYEAFDGAVWKRGHFRARKNLVLDVIEPEDILQTVRSHATQDNKALVKSEFGKIRLAVSAPLPVYLQQAYLYSVAGCPYLNWPGNTLEESLEEEMSRNERTIVLMRRGFFALPYDFSRFDHQPTTPEILEFQRITFTRALLNANPWQSQDIKLIEHLLELSFDAATLTTPPGICEPTTFRVTGGLMSGLRSTSAVGSGWNSVLGEMSRDIAAQFRGPGGRLLTWQIVRGDDTQVVSEKYLDVLAVKIGYDALGAEANESKFTLRQGRTEFLRVETGAVSRCYPCRTVPLINQQKPWSGRPDSDDASAARVMKVVNVLSRRVDDPRLILDFGRFVAEKMVTKKGVDVRLLSIPVSLGGLGLLPWDGKWAVESWNRKPQVQVRVLNTTAFRLRKVYDHYSSFGIRIKHGEAEKLADQSTRQKITTDDLLEVAGMVRRLRRSELARRSIVQVNASFPILCSDTTYYLELVNVAKSMKVTEGQYRVLATRCKIAQSRAAPLFASEKRNTDRVMAITQLAAVRRCTAGKLLRQHVPTFYRKLVQVEKGLKLRRASAIDYLLGNMSVPGADWMPPCVPRLAAMAGAVLLSELSARKAPQRCVDSLRWYGLGVQWFARAMLDSEYGVALLHI
uniref:RNA-directed RNA polymerase n=1 Tax=Kashgar Totiv tick virus 1 TaxID=2972343 RepID=A0A9E8A9Q6_9VIRU|nr:MAG: RNA-dependent RNA polymerase [Kashgar Totiv tick virus 1]